ncbi:MAG TPA: DUF72 domain-containing protein [Anaerolineae bacterium]
MSNWHIGTMGFSYKEWQGAFYPAGMASRDFLGHYGQFFNAVEMDSTFYGTPRAEYVERWAAAAPSDFTFCPKTPRAITHESQLTEATPAMLEFLDTVALLDDKLGAVLLQFPPDFTYIHAGPLDDFLGKVPAGRRYAVEFRHRSWNRPETADLLQRHNVCWVAADYIYMPREVQRTADFLYLRFLGRRGQFGRKDQEQVDKTAELQKWRQRIQPHLAYVTDVYAFFNDDYAGHAPASANRFREVVGLEKREIRPPQQGRLF